jgi:Family of unknown function (DUF6585)/Bacterial PH domain
VQDEAMLGPELETFRGNRGTMLAWALVIAVPAVWLFTVLRLPLKPAETYFGVTLGLIALIVGWLASIRLSIHHDGVSYQSWFGRKEIRWENLERYYFSSARRSVEFVPVGTYYHFRLEDSEGSRLRFGNRVGRLSVLANHLAQATYPGLYKKAAEEFNRGGEVDFGDVKIGKTQGIRIRRARWGGLGMKWVEIPWNQVHAYNIQKGRFYVWRRGEKKTTGPELRRVPNAFVLKGILDSIFKPAQA